MPRVALVCRCGWSFFASETAPGPTVPCPSCGEPVVLPRREPGAEGPADRKKLFLILGLIGGAIALVVIILVVLVSGGGSEPLPEKPRRAASRRPSPPADPGPAAPAAPASPAAPQSNVRIVEVAPAPAPAPPPTVTVRVTETPPPPPPEKPAPDPLEPKPPPPPDWRRIVDRSIPLLNMAGIGAELMRCQKDTAGYDRMVAVMNDHERRIREGLAKLAEKGTPYNIPARLAPHDRLQWFAGKDLGRMPPAEIAAFLRAWMKKCQAGTLEKASVLRANGTIDLFLFFPERSGDLLDVMKLAGVGVDDAPAVPAVPLKIPEDLVKGIEARFKALPAGYRKLVPPDELEKMDSLAKKGLGSPDEIDFLRLRIAGDLLPLFEREAERCRARAKELEPEILDTATDRILMDDGRVLEGRVKDEDGAAVTLHVGFGTVKLNKAEIKEIQKGKGASSQFPERFKAAQGKVEDLAALMAWCKESRLLARQREYLACLILARDPAHEKARAELNLPGSFASKAAPPPPPPPAPPPPAMTDEETLRKVRDIAAEVVRKNRVFADVVAEMRNRTQGLAYIQNVAVPERFNPIAAIIADPIRFTMGALEPGKANTVRRWWDDLDTASREDFARFFGLWCIAWRAVNK